MKTLIALILTLGFVTNIFAQADKYETAMQEALQLFENDTEADLQKAANSFERIAGVATDEWLPRYYEGLSHLYLAGMAANDSKWDAYEQHLDKAQAAIDAAKLKVASNSELAVLQAYVYQGRIWKNPMIRGAKYSPSVVSELEKAMKLDPNNPRASYLMAQQLYHTPSFFGGGADVALPHFEAAAEKYAKFEPASKLHPNWGQENNARFLSKIQGEAN